MSKGDFYQLISVAYLVAGNTADSPVLKVLFWLLSIGYVIASALTPDL